MDRWLDDLARSMAGGQSRRALLRRLGGGFAAAVLASMAPTRAGAQASNCCSGINGTICCEHGFTCIPGESGLGCGPVATCCAQGSVCTGGPDNQCVCPDARPPCGAVCCPTGTACVRGPAPGAARCDTSCPDGRPTCGSTGACCPPRAACRDGQCVCVGSCPPSRTRNPVTCECV